MQTLLTILYGVVVIGASAIMLSLEYYARKARVSAAPSVPWMRKAVIARLKKEVETMGIENPVIYELGSGWGTLAFDAAKACPNAIVKGFEISPVPLWVSRFRGRLKGLKSRVQFENKDIFEMSYYDADIILTYLLMPHMERLGPKLSAELLSSARVICNTFPVPGWTPAYEETVQDFVYTLKVYSYTIGVEGTDKGQDLG